jgi:transposase-like protein
MTEDICGAECADGSPCELGTTQPDDKCHLHTAHDPSHVGRDKIEPTDTRREQALEAAEDGLSMGGCARAAGVSKDTLYRWLDEHPDFSTDFARARARAEKDLARDALQEEVNPRMAQFLLARAFDYTERQEIEHDGEIDTGNIVIDFSDTST